MTIPLDNKLDIRPLSQIYNNTVATYKYYWFVSILDIVSKEGLRRISFWEIIVGMVAEAWYPIHYFRLSFGKSDSLYEQISALQHELRELAGSIKNAIINFSQVNGKPQRLTIHYYKEMSLVRVSLNRKRTSLLGFRHTRLHCKHFQNRRFRTIRW